MKTMTAFEAKNSFGKFLTASQREPVLVTKNSQPMGAMFSMDDLQNIASSYLSDFLLEQVEVGELDLIEAMMRQSHVDQRIAQSEAEIEAGQFIEMNDAFFDDLRKHVDNVAQK